MPEQKWEEEFDKECCNVWYGTEDGVKRIEWLKDPQQIKSFITSLLQNEHEKAYDEGYADGIAEGQEFLNS